MKRNWSRPDRAVVRLGVAVLLLAGLPPNAARLFPQAHAAPGPATHLVIDAPAVATAGVAFTFTITAMDAARSVATGNRGTVHFSSSDRRATLPADATVPNGARTLTAIFTTAGKQTITGSDRGAGITGIATTIVAPAAAARFVVTLPGRTRPDRRFWFMVWAEDPFGNTAIGYSGDVRFAGSDSAAVLPVQAPLTTGTGTFRAMLRTAGTQTITAAGMAPVSLTGSGLTQVGITGSGSTLVGPAPAWHFTVRTPSRATLGVPFRFKVVAQDRLGHTVTHYRGLLRFGSTDLGAVLPTLAPLTGGTGTFSAILRTPGNQLIAVSDMAAGLSGTSRVTRVIADR
jgi:hypothetical protein